MGRRQRLLQAYKRSAVRTVVLTIMFLSVAQWLLHSQPRKAAPASIPEHNAHFIVVTTQRSGSRWLVDEIRRARCIDCGGEYFNTKDFWTTPKMRAAVDGFLTLSPGKNVSVVGTFWGAYMHKDPKVLGDSLKTLLGWYAEGKLKPHVSETFPMVEAPKALRALMERRSTGKVVIDLN